MHARVLLKHAGLRYSKAYEAAEFLYFISYFVGRMVGLNWLGYYLFTCEPVDIIFKLVCAIGLLQSYLNLWRMYPIVKRRFKEMNER